MTLEPVVLEDWSGGEQQTLLSSRLPLNQSVTQRNLWIRAGALAKRPGLSCWGQLPGASACRWLGAHRRSDGGQSLFAVGNVSGTGTLFRLPAVTGADVEQFAAVAGVSVADSGDLEGVQLHRNTYLTDQSQLYILADDGSTATLSDWARLEAPGALQAITPCERSRPLTLTGTPGASPSASFVRLYNGEVQADTTKMEALFSRQYAPGLGDQASLRCWVFQAPTGTEPEDYQAQFYYNFGAPIDLTAEADRTDLVHFLLYFPKADWEKLTGDANAATSAKLCLWNGDPTVGGTVKVTTEIRNVYAGQWVLASIARADAEDQARLQGVTDFWETVQAVGVEINARSSETYQFYWASVIFPGLLADQTETLEVATTYWNETTGIESGLSPIKSVSLFDSREHVQQVLGGARWSHYGVLYLNWLGEARDATHLRVYLRPEGGAWYRAAEVAYSPSGGQLFLNVRLGDLDLATPPYASSADVVPLHLARWSQPSRLVALGCVYDAVTYRERVWISNWLDPLSGLAVHWPELTLSTVELEDRVAGTDGLFFDVPGAEELLAGRELGGWLYLFARGGVWRLQGSDSTSFACGRVQGAVGCLSAGSVVESPNSLIYLGADRVIYAFDGQQFRPLGGDSPHPMRGLLETLPRAALEGARGFWADGCYYLHFASYPEASVYGILYDSQTGTWSELQDGWHGHGIWVEPDPGAPLVGSQDAGEVWRLRADHYASRNADLEDTALQATWTSGLVPLVPAGHQTRLFSVRLRLYHDAACTLTLWDDRGVQFHSAAVAARGSLGVSEVLVRPASAPWTRAVQVQVTQTSTEDFRVEQVELRPAALRRQP